MPCALLVLASRRSRCNPSPLPRMTVWLPSCIPRPCGRRQRLRHQLLLLLRRRCQQPPYCRVGCAARRFFRRCPSNPARVGLRAPAAPSVRGAPTAMAARIAKKAAMARRATMKMTRITTTAFLRPLPSRGRWRRRTQAALITTVMIMALKRSSRGIRRWRACCDANYPACRSQLHR